MIAGYILLAIIGVPLTACALAPLILENRAAKAPADVWTGEIMEDGNGHRNSVNKTGKTMVPGAGE
jgi:hypothetical protein